jgi:hypothetical protein
MDEKIVQEMLHELFSSLEALDTQNAAILQFLKDKGIASDQDLAPYLEQAENASSVRWLATSVRMNHLLSSAIKADEKKAEKAEKEDPKAKEESRDANAPDDKSTEKAKASAADKPEETGKDTQAKATEQKETKKDSEATNQAAAKGKGEPEKVETSAGKDTKQDTEQNKDMKKNAA